ncbi:hypothetical protein [Methanospirillum lacunae]|uniref:hypothetical protein n=1 Tax=Methanospirillum lacunae TaxID=668570 RepID=UPI001C63FF3E|nr:hypothetical protein [Methanospirillum lacunae]
MKYYAGPIHVDVGMLKIIPQKEYILDIRDDFFPINTKDFKDTVKSSFAEGREGKFSKHFRPVDPVMRPLYAEVIRQFVTDEGSKEMIDIDTPRLVFSEDFAKVQDFIQLISPLLNLPLSGLFNSLLYV